MRFVAPARADVSAACLQQPIFAPLAAFDGWLASPDWPAIADVDARLAPLTHRCTGKALCFESQDAITDELHYEQRIIDRGVIATRERNWHDLFNALCWARFPAIKSALNLRQVADLQQVGPNRRTRAQDALTQFDEAGAVVLLRDADLLAAWDEHDWQTLFLRERDAWRSGGITLHVFGHALFEHALAPAMLPVAKVLVWQLAPEAPLPAPAAVDAATGAVIRAGKWLCDPQELRPLPLPGLPGWRPEPQDAAFYRDCPCFRPRRPGRDYPPARLFDAQSGS